MFCCVILLVKQFALLLIPVALEVNRVEKNRCSIRAVSGSGYAPKIFDKVVLAPNFAALVSVQFRQLGGQLNTESSRGIQYCFRVVVRLYGVCCDS
jgi:hypothetical protein